MASISKIRYTNVIYENGGKRYNDEIFTCAGHNTAILLENGGGKTVFIQAALQAVLPHTDLGERKAKETFVLDGEAAHIAIEWIISDKPRRYGLTAVTLYLQNNELRSYKYAYEYGVEDKNTIETLPFTREEAPGQFRAATRVEMNSYYQEMSKAFLEAQSFATTKEFHQYIEAHFKIIPEEWRSITVINGGEGSVEAFFDGCKTTADLVDKLLLPTVEQGLVGKGSEEFANTFESQREHFNKHKQLERSIKESEKIKAQIEAYVSHYSAYHQKVKEYEVKKSEAKGIWQFIETREQQTRENLFSFDAERKSINQQKEALAKEAAWIEVSKALDELKGLEKQYETDYLAYKALKDKQGEKEQRRHLLKLSRFQNNLKEAEAKMKFYEQQLAVLDEDTEVEDLKEALEENSSQIKGYFEASLEKIKREKQHSEREKERYEEEEKQKRQESKQQRQVLESLRGSLSKSAGKVEHQQKQMNQIKLQLMAELGHEDLESQVKKWEERLEAIEDHKLTLKQQQRNLEQQLKEGQNKLEQQTEKRMELLKENSQVSIKLEQVEAMQGKVLKEVQTNLSGFENLSSLYLKPQQVMETLTHQIEKLTREKEEALLMERRQAQFLENYGSHDFFTAEPLLEAWVEKWASQFERLQTGTAFIAGVTSPELKAELQKQPKWLQRVVVSDEGEAKLLALLEENRHLMTYPIGVVTLSKANKLVETPSAAENGIVYPITWTQYMQPAHFEEHKNEAAKALEETVAFRQQKEKDLRKADQLLEKVTGFFESYPHEAYAALRENEAQLKNQMAKLEREVEEGKTKLALLEKENKLSQETQRKEAEEKVRLQAYLEKTMQYVEMKKESEQEESKMQVLQADISQKETVLDGIEREMRDLFEAVEEAKEDLSLLRSSELRLREDPLYKEVKEERASTPREDLVYLRSQREQLKESLSNKQRGRSELEALYKQNQKIYEESAENFRQEQAESETKGLEIPEYREEFVVELERLTEELKGLKQQLEALDGAVKQAKTDFDKKEQSYQSKKAEFEAMYEVLEPFTGDYAYALERLANRENTLNEKEKYLLKQISGLEKELKVILELKQQMDKKDELYGYCAPSIEASPLEEAVQQECQHDLKLRMVVGEILETLEQLKEALEKGKKGIEEQKSDFKWFCQREISDSKLRNMAVQGMMQKENYEELVSWTDSMVERINHTLTILERDLVDQDQQISQFMIHLYAYLRTVVTELAEIPKKTRVNTEEGWKMVYEFVIPTWQEESGKEKIRDHIYSLLDDIAGQSFLDETGKEDVGKIKKYIKEQFKLRTLLKVVMGNEAIRVRCRKVSNVSDISVQKYSWETSNKWSGGEKWSKNMALYLGILNYLAEKKQNIQGEEQKVSRVVILDNPFGKASSGHVLEPVFFIAKQLGFQIIALTAHSEGDFIRRYFPIVYSCKLRSTLDQRTSIFTKEQEIKKAYFVDHDPVALSILGSNQLGLFS